MPSYLQVMERISSHLGVSIQLQSSRIVLKAPQDMQRIDALLPKMKRRNVSFLSTSLPSFNLFAIAARNLPQEDGEDDDVRYFRTQLAEFTHCLLDQVL